MFLRLTDYVIYELKQSIKDYVQRKIIIRNEIPSEALL